MAKVRCPTCNGNPQWCEECSCSNGRDYYYSNDVQKSRRCGVCNGKGGWMSSCDDCDRGWVETVEFDRLKERERRLAEAVQKRKIEAETQRRIDAAVFQALTLERLRVEAQQASASAPVPATSQRTVAWLSHETPGSQEKEPPSKGSGSSDAGCAVSVAFLLVVAVLAYFFGSSPESAALTLPPKAAATRPLQRTKVAPKPNGAARSRGSRSARTRFQRKRRSMRHRWSGPSRGARPVGRRTE